MKKSLLGAVPFAVSAFLLSGCSTVGDKAASLSIIYGATAVLSLLLLIACCYFVRKNKAWFVLLFSSVLVVNIGYTLLSVSSCLDMALMANRIAYLGSVFLPLSMLMIIMNVTNTAYGKWFPGIMFVIAAVVFLIAASPGILDIYYKEVSFEVIEGVSTLVKVYGPLHPLYLVYLLGHFISMVAIIVRTSAKKSVESLSHSVILAIAVFVNIGVWFIEQLTDIEFEMLSVSYIISELFLLGIHLIVNENQRLRELVLQNEEALKKTRSGHEKPDVCITVSPETVEQFTEGVSTLTPTERTIYKAYLNGASTKDILASLCIKENTLKFHNKNIYSKLGVTSRKQLIEVHNAIEKTTETPE